MSEHAKDRDLNDLSDEELHKLVSVANSDVKERELDSDAPCAVVRCLADVHPQGVSWLWPLRFPLGKLSLVSGDPGLGKSFLTMCIVAHVTTGRQWPDGSECLMGSALILNAEDDAADTIRPRLDAMDADVARVCVLDAIREKEKSRGFALANDLPQLERVLHDRPGMRLLVIDPISAYLGGRVDSHKNSDVRGLLAPLSELAARSGVAVIAVTHLSKSSNGGKSVYRSMGSLAFTAAARSVWSVSRAKDDGERRLLLPIKQNLSYAVNGLAYRIVNGALEWEPGAVEMTADDALAEEMLSHSESKSEMAVGWLQRLLADGPVAVTAIKQNAKAAGLSWRTVERAKEVVRVEAVRQGFGGNGEWVWNLKK